jgi:drug/metabolite transporter (DMT)-like permease
LGGARLERVLRKPGERDAMEQAAEAPRARVILAFAAIYLVWGSTYLAISYAVQTLPPFLMAGVRFLVAGGALYVWALVRGAARPTRFEWKGAAIIGALLLLGGNGGVVWAEMRIPSGLAALLVATVPLWMVLIEWWGGGAGPGRSVVAGLAVGFVGLALLIGPADFMGGVPVDPLGTAAVIAGSLCWAFGSVAARRVRLPSSPILGTGMEMLAGGALLLLAGSATGEWGRLELSAVSRESVLALLYLITIGSWIGFTAYVWLLRHVEVSKVSTYAYVNPVVAVVLGWAIAGEPLSPRMLLATFVIVVGVVFITTGRRRPSIERAETAPATAGAEA